MPEGIGMVWENLPGKSFKIPKTMLYNIYRCGYFVFLFLKFAYAILPKVVLRIWLLLI